MKWGSSKFSKNKGKSIGSFKYQKDFQVIISKLTNLFKGKSDFPKPKAFMGFQNTLKSRRSSLPTSPLHKWENRFLLDFPKAIEQAMGFRIQTGAPSGPFHSGYSRHVFVLTSGQQSPELRGWIYGGGGGGGGGDGVDGEVEVQVALMYMRWKVEEEGTAQPWQQKGNQRNKTSPCSIPCL